MKTAVFILSVLVLILLAAIILLCHVIADKNRLLRGRFTVDQVMNAWFHLYNEKNWEYHNTFFTEGLSLRDFLSITRLGSRRLIEDFNETCRKINRID